MFFSSSSAFSLSLRHSPVATMLPPAVDTLTTARHKVATLEKRCALQQRCRSSNMARRHSDVAEAACLPDDPLAHRRRWKGVFVHITHEINLQPRGRTNAPVDVARHRVQRGASSTPRHNNNFIQNIYLTTNVLLVFFISLQRSHQSVHLNNPLSTELSCFDHSHHGMPDTFTACQVYEATSEPERQRQNAIHEFIKTEVAFRDDLDVLLSQYAVLSPLLLLCSCCWWW